MSNGPSERRRTRRRYTPEEHGIVSTRVRLGYDVSLIDVSTGGALIETAHRLLPGSSIELHLATREQRAAVRGRVLRCAVTRLRASGVWYRGAIGFEGQLPWFVDHDDGSGYSVPGAEIRPGQPGRGAITPYGV